MTSKPNLFENIRDYLPRGFANKHISIQAVSAMSEYLPVPTTEVQILQISPVEFDNDLWPYHRIVISGQIIDVLSSLILFSQKFQTFTSGDDDTFDYYPNDITTLLALCLEYDMICQPPELLTIAVIESIRHVPELNFSQFPGEYQDDFFTTSLEEARCLLPTGPFYDEANHIYERAVAHALDYPLRPVKFITMQYDYETDSKIIFSGKAHLHDVSQHAHLSDFLGLNADEYSRFANAFLYDDPNNDYTPLLGFSEKTPETRFSHTYQPNALHLTNVALHIVDNSNTDVRRYHDPIICDLTVTFADDNVKGA